MRRALIVEDSPAADQLRRYLSELGIEVAIHPRSDGVIASALAVQPDVIILDSVLPHASGWEILTQLKADPRTQAIPVLVVSVVDEPRAGPGDLGAAGYLVKPITRQHVCEALRRIAPAWVEHAALARR